MNQCIRKLSLMFLVCFMSKALSGCNDATDDATGSAEFELYIENPLRTGDSSPIQGRNYDPDSIPPAVRLNNLPAEVTPLGGGEYQVAGNFSGSKVTVDVEWSQIYESVVLQLAAASKSFTLSDGADYSILAADYIINFDSDGDLDFNLDELKNGSNPRNSNSCSRCRSDVASHINRIQPSQRPEIDGQYDPIWNSSQFKDINGDAILTAGDVDDGRVFRFASMHDDQNLYLFILQDTQNGSDSRNTEISAAVNFYSMDSAGQAAGVFSFPDSAILEAEFTFPLLDENNAPYTNDTNSASVGTNSVVVWEVSFDLASLDDTSVGPFFDFSTERFFLGVEVFDELTDWIWQGVVIVNQ